MASLRNDMKKDTMSKDSMSKDFDEERRYGEGQYVQGQYEEVRLFKWRGSRIRGPGRAVSSLKYREKADKCRPQ